MTDPRSLPESSRDALANALRCATTQTRVPVGSTHENATTARTDGLSAMTFMSQSGASDPVERPAHYTRGKVECIDGLESAVVGLAGVEAGLTWSALKYLWRWKAKGGLEDLKKARWYLARLIAQVEGAP